VAEALKVLEWAGVLTRSRHRSRTRAIRCCHLWGREGWRWRVVRTSNAYAFRDPGAVACHAAEDRRFPSKSENPTGTLNQVVKPTLRAPAVVPDSPLERVLASLGALIAAKDADEGSR
jgi:hypothetical protein